MTQALDYRSKDIGLNIHSYENNVFKARSGYKQELSEHILNKMPVINFMRCPYERAFSSYLHIHNRHFIRQSIDGVQSGGIRVRRDILSSIYGDGVSIEYAFSFLEYLYWLKDQDLRKINPHHTPQYSPLYESVAIKHYKLEDFSSSISKLEMEFSLPDSESLGENFSSDHHTKKDPICKPVTLKLLRTAMPINPSPQFQIPKVTRQLLQGTVFDDLIADIFSKDIEIYDSIS